MIVRLTGGLGNQLFMYAFGRSISLHRIEPVKFFWARSTWDYALDAYNTRVYLVNPPIHNPIYDEKTFGFDEGVYATPPDTYFRGYWQTEKYFVNPEGLRKEFTLKTIRPEVEKAAEQIRGANHVFIHVRRGDYLNPGTAEFHGNLGHASMDSGYYHNAVSYMKEKVQDPCFIVFSDDPEWCKQNTSYPVVSGRFNQHEDLYLMSKCSHGIMANSTFGWWGNWLNEYPGKVCIAPKKWFNADMDTRDIVPERWVRL